MENTTFPLSSEVVATSQDNASSDASITNELFFAGVNTYVHLGKYVQFYASCGDIDLTFTVDEYTYRQNLYLRALASKIANESYYEADLLKFVMFFFHCEGQIGVEFYNDDDSFIELFRDHNGIDHHLINSVTAMVECPASLGMEFLDYVYNYTPVVEINSSERV